MRIGAEVGLCVERMLRGLEEDERRREASGSGEAATAATEGLRLAQAALEVRLSGTEATLEKFGAASLEAEAAHEAKQDAALSELRERQANLEQGMGSFMDEMRSELLASEEGARRELEKEREERITSGTEAAVAAAELQAWAEDAVARTHAELEAAVIAGVTEGLVASAATESVRYDAEVRHEKFLAEVAEEKRKSWEQASQQGAAIFGELEEVKGAREKAEVELREMLDARCGALEASAAELQTRAEERQRQAEQQGAAEAQRRGEASAALEARAAVEETVERLRL